MTGNAGGTLTRSFDHDQMWDTLRQFAGTDLSSRVAMPLKSRKKIQVYRIGATPESMPIIVKHLRREIGVMEAFIYQSILPRIPLHSIRFLGFSDDEQNREFVWLFLEDAGEVRYDPTKWSHRRLAGEWLGTLHATALSNPSLVGLPSLWPQEFFGRISALLATLEALKTCGSVRDDIGLIGDFIDFLSRVQQCQSDIERLADALPRTLVHGDFVAKNLRIRPSSDGGETLLVFDWDQSGLGPGPLDLIYPPLKGNSHLVEPDLRVYAHALASSGAPVELPTIRRFLPVSLMFRIVNAMSWVSWLVDAAKWEKYVSQLRVYHPWLRALEHDLLTGLDRAE